jgi:hypothetical protein
MEPEQIRARQLLRDIEDGADIETVLKMAYTIGQEDYRKQLKQRFRELPGVGGVTGYMHMSKKVTYRDLLI